MWHSDILTEIQEVRFPGCSAPAPHLLDHSCSPLLPPPAHGLTQGGAELPPHLIASPESLDEARRTQPARREGGSRVK